MVGERFGMLTVVGEFKVNGRRRLTCQCDCGTVSTVDRGNAVAGRTRSCGCKKRSLNGEWNSPTYRSWKAMRERCLIPTSKDFLRYGARGVTVCDRWANDFNAFLADMGKRPKGMSLDRIDTLGNYEPGNCRWATPAQQSANRLNTAFLTVNGETLPLSEWARRLGTTPSVLRDRKAAGWSDEDTASKPIRKYNKNTVATADQ